MLVVASRTNLPSPFGAPDVTAGEVEGGDYAVGDVQRRFIDPAIAGRTAHVTGVRRTLMSKERQALTPRSFQVRVAGYFLSLLMLLVGGACSSSESSDTNPTQRSIAGDSWYGCADRAYYEKLNSYAQQKDREAFTSALSAGLDAGTCIHFEQGETVYVMEFSHTGFIKIRREGATQEFWTNSEAAK